MKDDINNTEKLVNSVLDQNMRYWNSTQFEELGFEKIEEKMYRVLEDLGKGGFGKVRRAMYYSKDRTRHLVAIKSCNIIEASQDIDKKKEVIKSFLVEKKISDIIWTHPEAEYYFTKCFGLFYRTEDETDRLKEVFIIYEAGNFSLKELLRARKRKQPYEEKEILYFLNHLAKGYRIMQELNIYHSDIKLDNIIFSKEKKSYLIIDFGVSRVIDENKFSKQEKGFKIQEIIKGGTKELSSPEKKTYLELNLNGEQYFNPYKCDTYSLGICAQKMMGEGAEESYAKELIKEMTDIDIEKRLDARSLCEKLEKIGFDEKLDAYEVEKKYLEKLEYKRDIKSAKNKIYDIYDELEMPNEQLRFVNNLRTFKMEKIDDKENDKGQILRDRRNFGKKEKKIYNKNYFN